MRNASKKRAAAKKSEQERIQHFLHKPVTRTFLEVSRCHCAKQRQRNDKKKCAARTKLCSFPN